MKDGKTNQQYVKKKIRPDKQKDELTEKRNILTSKQKDEQTQKEIHRAICKDMKKYEARERKRQTYNRQKKEIIPM